VNVSLINITLKDPDDSTSFLYKRKKNQNSLALHVLNDYDGLFAVNSDNELILRRALGPDFFTTNKLTLSNCQWSPSMVSIRLMP
jgi:hypothetical protein